MTYFRNFIKLNNSDPKPEKVIKEKKKYSFKKKPTGEKDVFEKIFAERPHFCQVCFTPIGEATPSNFPHVLPKAMNKYPKFKLNPANILLACEDCHVKWDHKRKSIESNIDWQWVFHLEQKLKEEYKLL
jgi:5-methylcytosine-specific restriction endonuclease McrA